MIEGIQGKNPWVSFVVSTVPVPIRDFFIIDEQEGIVLENLTPEKDFFLEGVSTNIKYNITNYFRSVKQDYNLVLKIGNEYSDIVVLLEEGLKAYFASLTTQFTFNKWINFVSFVGKKTLIPYGQIISMNKSAVGDGTDAITYSFAIKSYQPPLDSGFGKLDKGVEVIS